jgi:UDP-N-acetylmuramate dehydrogenase
MKIQENVKLSEILWYKIGGITKYLLTCESKEDIYDALELINKNDIKKIFVCGLGSNLIFTDDYFEGAVIRITTNENSTNNLHLIENGDEKIVEAFAGSLLDEVITFSLDHNLTGLEWAGGLPGTIGAAVRGNVGAYGGEIKESLFSAEVLIRNETGGYEIQTFQNKALNFSYRHSLIKDNPGNFIVLSAKFQLRSGSSQEINEAIKTYNLHINQRKERHPLEYPNCGSVFKNIRESEKIEKVLEIFPEVKEKIDTNWYGKIAAGYLIQKLGLQGFTVGDAQISMKHALFIVNLGQAKARDVLTIINTIQEKFKHVFGFTLDPEVEIVK